MLTVYVVTFNEEVFLQFFIDHYRALFPNCKIVLYDNESTDKTTDIAIYNNCEVRSFSTNNQISDRKYLEIKNSCWKTADTDWVLICDADELFNINQSQLIEEENNSTTIVKSEAYNMINMKDDFDLKSITYGSRCEPYDKSYLFNKKFIKEINYAPGCHTCKPQGTANFSQKAYHLYHYKCINPDFQVARYNSYAARLSPENKKYGWGSHYIQTEADIRNGYVCWRAAAIKIIED